MAQSLLRSFYQMAKRGRPPKPVPQDHHWYPERIQTPNTLIQKLFEDYPFDTGLLTATGRTHLEEREGLSIFEEMSRDPQVVAAYALKRNAIISGRWVVEPASEDPQDVEMADYVRWNLMQVLGDTGLGLKPVMSAFLYGRSVSEIIWDMVPSGDYQGLYRIVTLKPKNIGAIAFRLDPYNNIEALHVTNLLGERSEVHPFKVVHYAWGGEFENPYGKPDLAAVYPWWWAKKTLYKYSLIFADKYASPIPNFKVERKLTQQEETLLRNAAMDFHISNHFITPKGVELELLQNNGTAGTFYLNFINQVCNAEIARAILAQTLTTNENAKTGTFAQAEVHQSTLKDILEEVRNEVERKVVQDQLVKRLVDVNWPNVVNYPRFRFEEFDADFLFQVSQALEKLCTIQDDFGNRLVDPKEPWIRERINLPARNLKEFPLLDKMPEHRKPEPNTPPAGTKPKKVSQASSTNVPWSLLS